MGVILFLRQWLENFERNREKVRQMFDDSFVRRWRLILAGSMAGFSQGDVRLYQILFSIGLNPEYPLTREHMYRGRPIAPLPAGGVQGVLNSLESELK